MLDKYRYIEQPCHVENCPVQNTEEFEAEYHSYEDRYRVYQEHSSEAPSFGLWFAACSICLSHTEVEKRD